MAKKKKGPGRPKVADKVNLEYVYLKKSEKSKILAKHESLTKALLDGVLPEC